MENELLNETERPINPKQKCIECYAPTDSQNHELCKDCYKHEMRVRNNKIKYSSGNWLIDNWKTVAIIALIAFILGFIMG